MQKIFFRCVLFFVKFDLYEKNIIFKIIAKTELL